MENLELVLVERSRKHRRYLTDPVEIREYRKRLLKSWARSAMCALLGVPSKMYQGFRKFLVELTVYAGLASIWFFVFGIMMFLGNQLSAFFGG